MPSDCITFQNSGYFSKLMVDYLNQEPVLKPLYNRFPTLENFEKQLEEKSINYTASQRSVLVQALLQQYKNTTTSKGTKQNLELLAENTTFTVTTGHQLNLFTGPLYFLYKIIATINLTEQLKTAYPHFNFVPIYWMATEDHDFEEINHFTFEEKIIHWNKEASGPVGRLSTQDLASVFEVFAAHLGPGNHAAQIKKWFEEAYLQHDNLTDATRFLANALFGAYGLVIVDGDDKRLKELFLPHVEKELLKQESFQDVNASFSILASYFIQVNPREINLFYIKDNLRERIVFEDNAYKVNNTSILFSQDALLAELRNYPERFSPNVILRPLYQEVILPNLCYIGGGGELAYWLELKKVFENHQITFPMLLLRNSVLLVTEKQAKKIDKLALTWGDLFLKSEALITQKTKEFSQINFDFNQQKQFLEKQFQELEKIALKTDKSFIGAVLAQKQKQLNGLNHLEKRLLKAEKKAHKETLARISELQLELFPNNSLQERIVNFSEYYKEYGPELIPQIKQTLNPLSQNFDIIILK